MCTLCGAIRVTCFQFGSVFSLALAGPLCQDYSVMLYNGCLEEHSPKPVLWLGTIHILNSTFLKVNSLYPFVDLIEVKNKITLKPPPNPGVVVMVIVLVFGFYFLECQLDPGANCLLWYGLRVHIQI